MPLEAVLGKALVVELAAALVEVSVELGRGAPARGKGKRGASRGLRLLCGSKRTRGNLSHAGGMLKVRRTLNVGQESRLGGLNG